MTEAPAAPPCLALIGGRLEADNGPVFAGLRKRCKGSLLVLATASLIPEEVGPDTVLDMQRHRIPAELLPLTWDNHASAAFDPALVTRIDQAGGVYFTGGDQSHLLQALHQQGKDTPLLQAIRRLAARGGLVSGSSAGAAVMSALSILGGTSLEAVVYGVAERSEDPGLLIGRGLGFFSHGLVDQHFLQRGRIGRLLVAIAAVGERFGFGIDENTCLFVDGPRGDVVGEKGVVVLDAREASFDIAHRHYDRFRVSYLDDGDSWDFAAGEARPKATRRPIRRRQKFAGPGYVQRSIFGPYAFDELLTRLAAGDPKRYVRDHAVAYEPDAQIEVSLEVERSADPGHSLSARRGRSKRYTVLDYHLDLRSRPLGAEQHREWVARHSKQLMRGRSVADNARLIAIGAALKPDNAALFDHLRRLARPITVIAAASAAAREVGNEYVDLLQANGIGASVFDPREDDALAALSAAPAILFTGGNQDRLRQALFTLGEESPLLQATLASYRAGGALIAIGGSAAALSGTMIAGGSSEEAIRFGASPDPGYRGVVLQEGLGLLRDGLIDQYFVGRNRLGRLLVACVEEGLRWGFGLAEDSGLQRIGSTHQFAAIGGCGFACLDLHQAQVHVHAHGFEVMQARLHWVAAGQSIDTVGGQRRGDAASGTPLAGIVERFIDEAEAIDGEHDTRCQVGGLQMQDADAVFNIEIQRAVEGRRSIPELDHRGRPKR